MSTQSDAEVAADVFAAAFLNVLKKRLLLSAHITTNQDRISITNTLFYLDPDRPGHQEYITSSVVTFGIDAPPAPMPRLAPR